MRPQPGVEEACACALSDLQCKPFGISVYWADDQIRASRGRLTISGASRPALRPRPLVNPRSLIAFRARAAPLPPSHFNIHSASRPSVLLCPPPCSEAWFKLFVLDTTAREIYRGVIPQFVLTIWSRCERPRATQLSDGRAAAQCATNNETFINIHHWFVTITFLITLLL